MQCNTLSITLHAKLNYTHLLLYVAKICKISALFIQLRTWWQVTCGADADVVEPRLRASLQDWHRQIGSAPASMNIFGCQPKAKLISIRVTHRWKQICSRISTAKKLREKKGLGLNDSSFRVQPLGTINQCNAEKRLFFWIFLTGDETAHQIFFFRLEICHALSTWSSNEVST